MDYENQTIGGMVEELIIIKDSLFNYLSERQIETINNACNVLDHEFNRLITVDEVLNKKE